MVLGSLEPAHSLELGLQLIHLSLVTYPKMCKSVKNVVDFDSFEIKAEVLTSQYVHPIHVIPKS